MESDLLFVEALSQLLDCADQIIVLCDSTKFEMHARSLACPIERIDTLVPDSNITQSIKETIEAQGARVIVSKGV